MVNVGKGTAAALGSVDRMAVAGRPIPEVVALLVVSWNVNSLNARMTHLAALVERHAPDIICLQETKCSDATFPELEIRALGYDAAPVNGGGREGVAILARQELGLRDVSPDLAGNPRPHEARWVEATVADVRIASTYVINGRTVDHPIFREKLVMLDAIRDRAAQLSDRQAMVVGDFNVMPTDADCWSPQAFEGSTHVTPEERHRISAIVEAGLADAFVAAPERGPERYTYWDYRGGAFHKNQGLRIDLALVSGQLRDRLEWVGIDRELRKNVAMLRGEKLTEAAKPSDHAPLLVRLAD